MSRNSSSSTDRGYLAKKEGERERDGQIIFDQSRRKINAAIRSRRVNNCVDSQPDIEGYHQFPYVISRIINYNGSKITRPIDNRERNGGLYRNWLIWRQTFAFEIAFDMKSINTRFLITFILYFS